MNDFDEKLHRLAKSEEESVPADFDAMITNTLSSLSERKNKVQPNRLRRVSIAVAAVLAVFIALPNISPSIAFALDDIPGLGAIVKVITFRDYQYNGERYNAEVSVPKVVTENGGNGAADNQAARSAGEINNEIDTLTNQLIEEFKTELEADGEGAQELYINSQVVTNTDTWFTLKLILYEGAGSGSQWYEYYHIDKRTGQRVDLSGLFKDGSDFVKVISDNIQAQMVQRMANDENQVYWVNSEVPEWDFKEIKTDQDFYFAADGNIVITFDEYEVAPGCMGCPEFEIPSDVVSNIFK